MRNAIAIFLGALLVLAALPLSAQSSAYYLFDGDGSRMHIFYNGALVRTVPTFSIGYPSAIRSSILLLDRRYNQMQEYDLGGNPVGGMVARAGGLDQFLDGATGTTYNYAAGCCGISQVYQMNADWTGATPLFPIAGTITGIAYDTVTGHLFITDGGTLWEYTTAGSLLNTFAIPNASTAVGLAYETATDTLWYYSRGAQSLVQISKTAVELQRFSIPVGGNPYGGEMAQTAGAPPAFGLPPVPALDPKSLAALAAVLAIAGVLALKLRA